jgi:hypothetical protein
MVTFTRRLSNTFDVNRQGIREVVDQTTPNKSSVINAQREAAHINAQEYTQQGKTAIAERGSRAPTKTEIALMERDNAIKEAYENRNKPVTFVDGEYHGLGYTAPPAVAGRGGKRGSSVTEDGHGLGYMAPPSRSGESVVDQSYTYSIYDSLGREQAITEKQYNEVTKAHGGNTNKNIVYTVLPEEVANSGADWWINDRGLYEWTPVTASDKEHLAKLNSQTGKNMTTLITGAAKSQEYSDKWYSTGGNRRQVKHNEKLSKMKSGDINTNASAKTGTAKEAKAVIIPGKTAGARKEAQALEEEASIRNGLTKYETKEDFLQVRAEKKATQEAAKRAEAAYKPIVGIDGQVIKGIEVKGSSKASEKGIQGIVSGEGYTSRGKAVNEFETRKAEAKEAAKEARTEAQENLKFGLTPEFYEALKDYTPEQQEKLIESRLQLKTNAEAIEAKKGTLYNDMGKWQGDYNKATKDVKQSNITKSLTGFTGNVKEKLSTMADGSVFDVPLTSLGTIIGGAGAVVEHSEAALKTGGRSLLPDLKIAAVGTAITPFAVAEAGMDVAGTKGTKINPEAVQLISDIVVTTLAFGAAGKVASATLKPVARVTGEATGIVRSKTFGSDLIPYKSPAQAVESVFENEFTTGSRAVPKANAKIGEAIRIRDPAALGDVPVGAEGSFMTIGSKNLEPFGKYFNEKGIPTGNTKFDFEKGYTVLTEEVTPTLKINQRVYSQKVRNVKIPETLKTEIYDSIKTKGNFEKQYPEVVRLAKEQSAALNEPIAIPSPKRASHKDILEPENEVFVVMTGERAATVTGKSFAGYTKTGVKVERVSFGNQPKPTGALSNIAENIKYNYDVGAARGGRVYKKGHLDSMVEDMYRREAELSGDALAYPDAYEYGSHGPTHVKNVETNMKNLGVNPKEAELLAEYHDIAKVGPMEAGPIPHAEAAEIAIKTGRFTNEKLASLSKQERFAIAKDIGTHTSIKPLNIKNIRSGVKTEVVSRPSMSGKALATADRMDLVRFGAKVDQSKVFFKRGETVQSMKLKESKSLMGDTTAELRPIKREQATKIKSTEEPIKIKPEYNVKGSGYKTPAGKTKTPYGYAPTGKSGLILPGYEYSKKHGNPEYPGAYNNHRNDSGLTAPTYNKPVKDYTQKPVGYKYEPVGYTPTQVKYSGPTKEYTPKPEYNPVKPSGYTPRGYDIIKPAGYNPAGYNPAKPAGYNPVGYSNYVPPSSDIPKVLKDELTRRKQGVTSTGIKYKARVKKHYVKDPIAFMLGNKKGRR